jgi:soluble lytic murein transglycosylase
MITNFSTIKFFFFLFFFFSSDLLALNYPTPQAKPEVPKREFADVFQQIKKQNWVMAIALADDYNNKSLSSYIRWLDITRPGSKHSFDYLVDFYNKHKNWPKKKTIIEKIESSITVDMNIKTVLDWFVINPPISSKGSIDFLEFRIKARQNFDKKGEIIKIWTDKNLTRSQQNYFIKKYSKFWTNNDNWNRFSRLLNEGKNVSARRTLNRIYGDLRKLGEAQIALSRRSPNVAALIKKVPSRLINDPGLIYERMRWRRKAKLPTAAQFLYDPPDNIKNVRNWWINSRIVVRRLINKKKFSDAYNILNNHKLPLTEESGREAEWLAGWVALHHLNKKKESIIHFTKVFENTKDENMKAKAAYWIAMSNNLLNEKTYEKKWLSIAAKNKFSFYGQNASIKIGNFKVPSRKVVLIKPEGFDELFDVIKIILKSDQNTEKTLVFFKRLLEISTYPKNKYFVLNEALKLNNKYIVTSLSKKLEKPSIEFSYPLIENYIPQKFKNSPPTLALIHAISHQESNFRINAYSSAGARGVMQLMPFTAKKVAKDLRIRYRKRELTINPQYNIILGTTYINEMLGRFKNSLPLALAAYNAGPSRVKIWLKRYGDPRRGQISYINWIESIPLEETRYYVKKVLANLRIYQTKYNLKLYEAHKKSGIIFAMPY